MAPGQDLPLRMMLKEINSCFRNNGNRPALGFALLRKVEGLAELVIVANNLLSLHDHVTPPYHFYEGWFEKPELGIAVSTEYLILTPRVGGF